MYGYLEWIKMPRGSIRAKYNQMEADVWPISTEYGKRWRFTVLDIDTGTYIDGGDAMTEDDACEYCTTIMNY